jgi:hypothetical protein
MTTTELLVVEMAPFIFPTVNKKTIYLTQQCYSQTAELLSDSELSADSSEFESAGCNSRLSDTGVSLHAFFCVMTHQITTTKTTNSTKRRSPTIRPAEAPLLSAVESAFATPVPVGRPVVETPVETPVEAAVEAPTEGLKLPVVPTAPLLPVVPVVSVVPVVPAVPVVPFVPGPVLPVVPVVPVVSVTDTPIKYAAPEPSALPSVSAVSSPMGFITVPAMPERS